MADRHPWPTHPAADVFPMLAGPALDELAADIALHGLADPVVIHRGVVVDGRNRLAACEMAGIDPRFAQWEGDEADLVSWIISRNLHRRHLDTSQRAVVAARLATLDHGQRQTGKVAGVPTQAEAAALVNVSERSVRTARTVLEEGTPELVAQVERGEVSVSKAASKVRPKPPDRTTAYQRGLDALDADLGRCDEIDPTGRRCVGDAGHEGGHTHVGTVATTEPAEPVEQTPISTTAGYDGDSWSTPDHIIETARVLFGGVIDLDPATNERAQDRIRAGKYYTKADNGLDPKNSWTGRVWLNPPYRRGLVGEFVARLVEEYEQGRVYEALLLVNNCTDTQWCQHLLAVYPACFVEGRVAFLYDGVEGEGARQGQIIFYLGEQGGQFRRLFRTIGVVVEARRE